MYYNWKHVYAGLTLFSIEDRGVLFIMVKDIAARLKKIWLKKSILACFLDGFLFYSDLHVWPHLLYYSSVLIIPL